MTDINYMTLPTNEEIVKFLTWAMAQPKGEGKAILVGECVPEPRS